MNIALVAHDEMKNMMIGTSLANLGLVLNVCMRKKKINF